MNPHQHHDETRRRTPDIGATKQQVAPMVVDAMNTILSGGLETQPITPNVSSSSGLVQFHIRQSLSLPNPDANEDELNQQNHDSSSSFNIYNQALPRRSARFNLGQKLLGSLQNRLSTLCKISNVQAYLESHQYSDMTTLPPRALGTKKVLSVTFWAKSNAFEQLKIYLAAKNWFLTTTHDAAQQHPLNPDIAESIFDFLLPPLITPAASEPESEEKAFTTTSALP